MAVTLQTIQSGPRHHIVHVTASGANTDTVVVDASAIDATDYPITKLKLVKAQWAVDAAVAGGIVLEWDQTTDAVLWECVGEGSVDFHDFGGVPNPAGTGTTGDVLLTSAAGLTSGTLLLHFHKS